MNSPLLYTGTVAPGPGRGRLYSVRHCCLSTLEIGLVTPNWRLMKSQERRVKKQGPVWLDLAVGMPICGRTGRAGKVLSKDEASVITGVWGVISW